jgi:antibiotic biosynthesis monooxygenase (ABM) superfamily enzyme
MAKRKFDGRSLTSSSAVRRAQGQCSVSNKGRAKLNPSMSADDADDRGPFTLAITRQVRLGREAAYEAWLSKLQAGVRRNQPGYLGATTLRPAANLPREYVIAVRFDSLAHLRAFETSDLLRQALSEVDDLVEALAIWQTITGLEVWFEPPPGALAPQPSRERMVLLLIAVVFGLVLTIGMAVTAATTWFSVSLPYPVRLLVGVTLQVIVMTYWLMPYLTRRLGRWLYPGA